MFIVSFPTTHVPVLVKCHQKRPNLAINTRSASTLFPHVFQTASKEKGSHSVVTNRPHTWRHTHRDLDKSSRRQTKRFCYGRPTARHPATAKPCEWYHPRQRCSVTSCGRLRAAFRCRSIGFGQPATKTDVKEGQVDQQLFSRPSNLPKTQSLNIQYLACL